MTRRALSALAAVAMLAAACSRTADRGTGADLDPCAGCHRGVDPALAPFYGQSLEWEPCREEFQCATARVPLDYDAPDGEVVELALLRAPATGDERIGSLLVNPGGPGGSGIDYATTPVVNDAVRERYDVVGFDPRGVGRVDTGRLPVRRRPRRVRLVRRLSGRAAEVMLLEAQATELAEGCATRAAAMLPHLGTSDVARDLDVLRAALGDEQLNYLGASYGTNIGALYAEQYPERVGRVVLDGAIDPALTGRRSWHSGRPRVSSER